MIAGLVGALVLVIGPFAGAKEHVITGSVLLVFALAWAAIAVFSERRTNQAQRWAIVPAAVMAGAGAIILVLAPTGNPLGWLWPPALAGLVAWMAIRARRDLDSRSRRWVLYPVFAALGLAALGGGYETVGENLAGAPTMTGRLIDVGGYRLHLDCVGTGSPTVVLEAGLGEPGADIAGWIAPDVSSATRVCSYDRAGRGRSDSATSVQDGDAIATQLLTLLTRAGEKGPFVLAGHSVGGLYVMSFARLYPDQVAGLVLLDSTSPHQYEKLSGYASFYQGYRRVVSLLPTLSRFGLGRAIASVGGLYSDLPPRARAEARASASSPRSARSLRDELSKVRTSMKQAQGLSSIGRRPLIVMTATVGAKPEWMGLQEDLLRLSSNSAQVVLNNADHAMLTASKSTASVSATAIRDVVSSARTGAAVAGKAT
jgi:pimeloyl-ACP methyl ester carboxylesterase